MRKNFLRGAPLLAALALSLGACHDAATDVAGPDSSPEAAAARRGQGGNAPAAPKIAFAVANAGIHTMNPDGSGYAAVRNTEGGTDPAWSPDRKKLAFAVPSGASAGIHVISPKGTKRVQLYAGPAGAPAWSPDGSRIAFHADVAGGRHLFVMNADGSNLQQATALGTVNRDPDWSPDGSRIAYFTNRPEQQGIWVMNADGTNRHRIAACTECAGPTWSPVVGAELIAYSFFSHGTLDHAGIRVLNSDGTIPYPNPDVLVYHPAHGTTDVQPSWSPDGTRIAFSSGMMGGGREVLVVDATTHGDPERLSTTPVVESAPAWAK